MARPSAKARRLGFRGDVRLFRGSLVGFLPALIIILLLLLQRFLEHTREVTRQNWSNVVRMTLDEVERANLLGDTGSLETRLAILQATYGMASVPVARPGPVGSMGVAAPQAHAEALLRP